MSETFLLSVHHVGAKDRMVMRSLLNLVNGRGGAVAWELLEGDGGDVTIIDVDSAEGLLTWEDASGQDRVLLALTSNKRFEARTVLHKPLRAREFLRLLEQLVGGEPVFNAQMTPDAQAPAPPTGVVSTQPAAQEQGADRLSSGASGLSLADHLRVQTWQGPIVLTEPGWPLLLIDPGSGAWFYDGSIADLDPNRFSRELPDSAGVAVSSAELVERIHGHRQRPLSELKWYAGLGQMPGRLHPELAGDVQFMLTQVPAEAMQNEQLHRLAQIVLRGPIDLQELLAESGQPEAHVVAFLNACFASGKLLRNRDRRRVGF